MFRSKLTRCATCKIESVVPIMDECIHNRVSDHWLLSLVCTSCHMRREVLVRHAQAEAFDRALDEQARLLQSAIRRFERASMEDDIQRFVNAVDADCIWPEDFVI